MKKFFLFQAIIYSMLVFSAGATATSTVSAPFTGTPIAAGNNIWFSAAVKITGTATYPLTIYFTDQSISSPAFGFSVPDAILILDPSVSVATTVFNGSAWVTTARPGEPGYYFLSGYRHPVATSLPGSLSPVSWTGTFTASRPGVSVLWHMAAAVYTSLSPDLNSLGVKPSDCSSCSAYANAHSSGAPENYLPYVIGGARGGGGSNYTGGFSGAGHLSPDAVNSNISVCAGSTTTLHTVSACSSWTSSNHAVATVSGGVITGISTGTSRISYLVSGCPMWQVVTVNVLAAPGITATATPSIMCAGATLTLNATTAGTAGGGCGSSSAVSWHGPAGFTSTLEDPRRTGMTPEMAGIYTVTVTDHSGCTGTATTAAVVVNKLPTAIAATVGPIPLCAGNTIHLNGTVTGGSGYTLLWTGGTSTINNSTTTSANITSATLTDAGTYTLTATATGCAGNISSAAVLPTVHKLPTTLTASVSPTPVCAGSSVTLRATSSGGAGTINYVWTGHAGGSVIVNPTSITAASITATNLANAGPYTVTASAEGCGTMTANTTNLAVNRLPSLTAVVNPNPVCVGGSYSLTGTVGEGAGYTLLWTGGTSTIHNSTTAVANVTGATLTDAGSYTLTATAPACGSTSANTNAAPLIVGASPTSTGPTNSGPVCAGGSVTLYANSAGATTWLWTGPGGFTSSLQNPTVTPLTTGTYSLVTGNVSGCGSATVYTTTVIVNAAPAITAAGGGTICNGAATTLTAGGGTTYSWSPSTGLSSATGASVTASPSATTVYTVTGTTSGCSNTATVTVSVNAAPTITAAGGGTICNGASTTLIATGGTSYSWSPSTGLSSAASASVTASPSATTVYTVTGTTSGCSNTATVTVSVNAAPTITAAGGGTICNGASTTLTATGGTTYSWSPSTGLSSATGAAVTATPLATTVYTVTGTTSGCSNTATVTVSVNAAPAITAAGGGTICNGATTTLTATGGTTYSWSPSTGLSSATSAIVTASPSATTIYTLTGTTSGCSNTATVTVSVNAAPAITAAGGGTICNGASTTLTATGGTTYSWSPSTGLSSATGASVNASPSATTVYTVTGTTSGCSNTATVMVSINPLPDAGTITGPGSVCVNANITLSNCTPGGTWSSGSTGIATVDGTGTVNGLAAGTVLISYTVTNDCGSATATKTITVNSVTAGLTGPSNIDVGSDILLSVTGGTWSSSNTTIATVDATGTVSGVSNGTATISYTMSNSCFAFSVTKVVTVNTVPVTPITGSLLVCVGNTAALSNATAGGTWSSDNTSVATVNATGVVTGVSAGTATISYSLLTGVATVVVSVNPLPAPITGVMNACAGFTTTLTDADEGGTWTITPTSVATIGSSSGVVSPAGSTGTATVTYTLPTGCFVTAIITINVGVMSISGPSVLCSGHFITLTDATTGGSWSSSNSAIASVGSGTGIVSGVSPGVADITYTVGSACFVTTVVTVAFTPMPIAGTLTLCQGSTTTLTDGTGGGSWSSGNTIVATVSAGIVSGISAGTAEISYTTAAGCSASVVVTVNTLQPITGPSLICIGSTGTFADATTGGTWSIDDVSIATIGSTTGVVTGLSSGIATITYTLAGGCYRTTTVNISTLTPITGTPEVCIGLTTSLANATPGGVWTTTYPSIATISSSGVVTGVSMGTNTISYSIGSCRVSLLVTVLQTPAMISGLSSVCEGASITLTDATPGGTWSTSSANISISGTATTSLVVTSVTPGVATVTYSAGTLGCYRLFDVTVRSLPAPIAGTFTVCPGGLTLLTDATTGGTWTSSTASIATVVLSSGAVAGNSTGTATITYKVSGGCITTAVVTVIASPSAILGPLNVCTGSSITLSDTSGPGTWSSSHLALATVGSLTGVVTGVNAGTPSITFTLTETGCRIKAVVTVTAIPNAGTLSGPTVMGVGSTISLVPSGTAGGSWSTSNANATVSSTGVVTGVAAGSCIITYAVTNECGYSGAYKPITIAVGRAAPTVPGRSTLSGVDPSGIVAGSAQNGTPAVNGESSGDFVPVNNIGPGIGYTTHASSRNLRRTILSAANNSANTTPIDVRVIPNPNNGTFTIRGLIVSTNNEAVDVEVRSIPGQLIYKGKLLPKNGVVDQLVQLNNYLPNGMYTLSIRSSTESKVVHFVMEH
jgi:trimeric autotransporter adhesin